MKKIALSGLIGIAIGVLIMLRPPFHTGFSDADIRQCEQAIKEQYSDRLTNSPSEAERRALEDGVYAIDVQMIRVADRKLEGYAKVSINPRDPKNGGPIESTHKCEAVMDIASPHFVWNCNAANF